MSISVSVCPKVWENGHRLTLNIGVVAIGTLGTQALPNKERNLSIRNQKVFKYWAQYKEISSKFKWIVLNLGHQQLILLSSQYCTWNISNRNQEQEKVPSLKNASTTPMMYPFYRRWWDDWLSIWMEGRGGMGISSIKERRKRSLAPWHKPQDWVSWLKILMKN